MVALPPPGPGPDAARPWLPAGAGPPRPSARGGRTPDTDARWSRAHAGRAGSRGARARTRRKWLLRRASAARTARAARLAGGAAPSDERRRRVRLHAGGAAPGPYAAAARACRGPRRFSDSDRAQHRALAARALASPWLRVIAQGVVDVAAGAGPAVASRGGGGALAPGLWRGHSAVDRCAATAAGRHRSGHVPSAAPGAAPRRRAPRWHTREELLVLVPRSSVAHSFGRRAPYCSRTLAIDATACLREAGAERIEHQRGDHQRDQDGCEQRAR